jgi:hypothetical protein
VRKERKFSFRATVQIEEPSANRHIVAQANLVVLLSFLV